LPLSVTRQSIAIVDGAGHPLAVDLSPVVVYDPVARTVTLSGPKTPWLTEGQPYTLILGIPDGASDLGGVRSIDRATLSRDQKLEYPFLVGPPANVVIEPAVTFCRDVLPIFTAKCNIPTCHGSGDQAAASLVLDTSAGVSATALSRIAQGSNTGPRSSNPPAAGHFFGIDMPIVDPGNPGNSWLMYKIDLAPLPPDTGPIPRFACTNGLTEPDVKFVFAPLVPEAQRTADESERAVLSDFILGREMPFPVLSPRGYGDTSLTFDEREKVRLWIKSLVPGGAIPECGGCGIVPDVDGGPADASASETGAPDASDDAGDAATDAPDGD
jgi:hypothetical protein